MFINIKRKQAANTPTRVSLQSMLKLYKAKILIQDEYSCFARARLIIYLSWRQHELGKRFEVSVARSFGFFLVGANNNNHQRNDKNPTVFRWCLRSSSGCDDTSCSPTRHQEGLLRLRRSQLLCMRRATRHRKPRFSWMPAMGPTVSIEMFGYAHQARCSQEGRWSGRGYCRIHRIPRHRPNARSFVGSPLLEIGLPPIIFWSSHSVTTTCPW